MDLRRIGRAKTIQRILARYCGTKDPGTVLHGDVFGVDSAAVPELPEVETVVRQLRPDLEGRRIERVEIRRPRTVEPLRPARFRTAVEGGTVARVWRRGSLVGHLRMTGRMQVGGDPGAYVVLSFSLDDGRRFFFVDVRRFGRLRWARRPEDALPPLGPEPLGDAFTADWLRTALRRRDKRLKPLLLNQSFLAGLGNIYVDEALFAARLHPLRRARTLDRPAVDRLHAAIRSILAAAVEHEGSTFDAFYRTPEGQPGSYQHKFRVYGRAGQPCRRCGAPVRRLVVGARGTHVCLRCQRPPRRPSGP